MTFSERYGYKSKPILYEELSDVLTNRIWNSYYGGVSLDLLGYYSNHCEDLLDHFGMTYIATDHNYDVKKNVEKLKKWFFNQEWYVVFDFIEVYLSLLTAQECREESEYINSVLIEENASYRILKGKITPITNQAELSEIENAQSTKYESVNSHIKKAIDLFSKRPNPDYANSIKESISAVEAICSIITGIKGKNATLGKTIKKLKDNGVHIHSALENAFSSLYGYTSNEEGIRHANGEPVEITIEDSKFILVTCSAFVNYLIEKWSKVESNGN